MNSVAVGKLSICYRSAGFMKDDDHQTSRRGLAGLHCLHVSAELRRLTLRLSRCLVLSQVQCINHPFVYFSSEFIERIQGVLSVTFVLLVRAVVVPSRISANCVHIMKLLLRLSLLSPVFALAYATTLPLDNSNPVTTYDDSDAPLSAAIAGNTTKFEDRSSWLTDMLKMSGGALPPRHLLRMSHVQYCSLKAVRLFIP